MSAYRIVFTMTIGAVLLLAPAVWAQTAEEMQAVTQFSGMLARFRMYVLPEADRGTAESANRNLRQAANEFRQAKDDEARKAALDRWAQAQAELEALVPKMTGATPITVEDTKQVLSTPPPIAFPAGSGEMVFRVNPGAGPVRFVGVEYDFSEESKVRIPCPVAPGTETWVLVSLRNIPTLKTEQQVEFVVSDTAKTILPLTLTTPDRGILRIAVRSREARGPVPAMVRITSKADGRDVKPGGALDFAPLFDHQGNFAGARRTNLPGALRGNFWCISGESSTSLPPGDYEVVVERGVEHVAQFDTVHIESHETVSREYAPVRWVDMRKRGWWSGDDHVHCQILSDSDARIVSTWTRAEDVRLANIVKMGDINRTWFDQRGFGPEFRVDDHGYILSPGQECPRTHNEIGHTLHMNISKMIRDTERYYLYDTVFDAVHADGGLSGYAHVNSNLFHVDRDMSMNIAKGKVDFVELLQFTDLGTDLFYDFLNTGFKVTASAGSDVPWGGTVGEVRVYAYLGRARFTADRWFEAVRQGHTFVTNGIMVDLQVDDAIPGDEIVVKENRPLRVRARAWGDARRTLPTKLEVVVHGNSVKTVTPTAGEAELACELDVPAGHGLWIAVRAEGADGSRAHTTPVYVVREGFRFWKYEDAEKLIEKRLTSLTEIEQIVASAQKGNSEGKVEEDRAVKQLALQGPALLERVKDAQAIYAGLKGEIERERPLRQAP